MRLWGIELPDDCASEDERAYLAEIARRHPEPVTLRQMWALTDAAWDACGASTERLDAPEARAFYRHPVWLVNGVFAEIDAESRSHRTAIAEWIATTGLRQVVDFGGGYGALARRIAERVPQAEIRIVDPFPSRMTLALSSAYRGIRHVPDIVEPAEVLVAQDVLEHVADPVRLAAHLVGRTRLGGRLLFANSFAPHIKCHVPSTFHLERSFPRLMALLGCAARGRVPCCAHALVFERVREAAPPAWRLALFEQCSRAVQRIQRLGRGGAA
jgi:hypothetical protein